MRGWRRVALLGVFGCGRINFQHHTDARDGNAIADDGSIAVCGDRVPVTGTTLWVSPTGLDSNPGTQAAPVQTITRAVTLATNPAGTTIVVGAGSYDSEPGDEVIVDTTMPLRLYSETRYAARVPRILCLGCADLVVEGFELTGSTVANLHTNAGIRVTFRDNLVHNGGSAGIRIAGDSSDVLVIGNLVYDTFSVPIHVNLATNVRILDNVVFGATATPGMESMLWLETVTDAIASGNVMFRARGNDPTYGILSLRTTAATVIENNVIAGAPDATSVYASIGFDLADGGAKIRHNTFVGPFPGPAFGLGVDAVMPGASFTAVNNIWASPGSSQLFTSGNAPNGTVVLRHNLYWNAPGAFPPGGAPTPVDDGEALTADPGLSFALPGAPTWAPVPRTFAGGYTTICDTRAALVEALAAIPSTSPAVGAADPGESPATDVRGRPRPMPAALGAYEP